MAEVPLRYLHSPSTRRAPKYQLKTCIDQINKQKGAFRRVTENSLLAEIGNSDKTDHDIEIGDDDYDKGEEKLEDRQALLWKGRHEILDQIE